MELATGLGGVIGRDDDERVVEQATRLQRIDDLADLRVGRLGDERHMPHLLVGAGRARLLVYQAFWEHIPLRPGARPRNGSALLYRRMTWGDLAEFSVLDARQYRDDQPCGDGEFPRCEASLDPDVTMLGFEQEAWLRDGLEDSHARWNVIANQVMMGQLVHDTTATATRATRRSTGTTPGMATRSPASGSSTTSPRPGSATR